MTAAEINRVMNPPKAKIYLACQYEKQAEMRELRDFLVAHNYEVTSRWIDIPPEETAHHPPEAVQSAPHLLRYYAEADLTDIRNADVFIAVSCGGGRGGRHVEFGYALALALWGHRKKLIVYGQRENIFHTIPEVWVVETQDDLLRVLMSG